MSKTQDFGEKIYGARKDLYAMENIGVLTDMEIKNVTRDNIWKKLNVQKELEKGAINYILYWKEEIRKAIPLHPYVGINETQNKKNCLDFIKFTNEVKDFVESQTSLNNEGFKKLLDKYILYSDYTYKLADNANFLLMRSKKLANIPFKSEKYFINQCYKKKFGLSPTEKKKSKRRDELEIMFFMGYQIDIPNGGMSKCYFNDDSDEYFDKHNELALKFDSLQRNTKGTIFLRKEPYKYSDTWMGNTYALYDWKNHKFIKYNTTREDLESIINTLVEQDIENLKNNPQRKQKFSLKPLDTINQSNYPEYQISGEELINVYGFRGGQFGNWLTEKERLMSLNMAYASFENLSKILDIPKDKIGLDGLGLAFGARGIKNALAHYEPAHNVINLTRLKGAGSLAHEYGHALDSYLSKKWNCSKPFASDCLMVHPIYNKLVDDLQYDKNGNKNQYYKDSINFGKCYAKQDGYWESVTEMLARAFACYIEDKMNKMDMIDNYLSSHASSYEYKKDDGTIIRAYPYGNERRMINNDFDKLFDYLRNEFANN